MHRRVIISTLAGSLWLWTPANPLLGQAPSNPPLRRELLVRLATDQAVRDTLAQFFQSGRSPDSAFVARMSAVDAANTSWIKGVIVQCGWPGRSLVGTDGANAAFLLVQHAGNDPAFMASALPLLERAVVNGESKATDYALLFDRVAVAAGGRQRFGTQAKLIQGRVVFDPIDDSIHVDTRRAQMGLSPLATYARLLDSLYTAHDRTGTSR